MRSKAGRAKSCSTSSPSVSWICRGRDETNPSPSGEGQRDLRACPLVAAGWASKPAQADGPTPTPPLKGRGLGENECRSITMTTRRCSRKLGRASCRERVCQYVEHSAVAVSLKKNKREYISHK